MGALIPERIETVDARELHASLGSREDFSTWIKRQIEKLCGAEGVDFLRSTVFGSEGRGGQNRVDYSLSEAFAERICVALNTPEARAAQSALIHHWKLTPVAMSDDALLLRAHEILVARVQEAEQALAIAAPKAEHFDAIMASDQLFDMGTTARMLNRPGHQIGRQRLFTFLRHRGVLQQNGQPYQQHIDSGLFRVLTSTWTGTDGVVHPCPKTMLTQRGVVFVRRILDEAAGQRSLLPVKAVRPTVRELS
jgi:anti-repressor protein